VLGRRTLRGVLAPLTLESASAPPEGEGKGDEQDQGERVAPHGVRDPFRFGLGEGRAPDVAPGGATGVDSCLRISARSA
jgi:hypothetical protein